MIEISHNGQLLAMILRADFKDEGIRRKKPDTLAVQIVPGTRGKTARCAKF